MTTNIHTQHTLARTDENAKHTHVQVNTKLRREGIKAPPSYSRYSRDPYQDYHVIK